MKIIGKTDNNELIVIISPEELESKNLPKTSHEELLNKWRTYRLVIPPRIYNRVYSHINAKWWRDYSNIHTWRDFIYMLKNYPEEVDSGVKTVEFLQNFFLKKHKK